MKNIDKYYQILELPRSATREEVKKAYKSLSLKWHPDRSQHPQAPEKFIEIRDAYEKIIKYIDDNSDIYNEELTKRQDSEPRKKAFEFLFPDLISRTQESWSAVYQTYLPEKMALYREYLDRLSKAVNEHERKMAIEFYNSNMAFIGAEIAASVKRVKREFICEVIEFLNSGESAHKKIQNAISSGHDLIKTFEVVADIDITPTLAQHFSSEIIRRGLDNRYLNAKFARKGRTAAEKTKTTVDDLSDVISYMQIVYAQLSRYAFFANANAKKEFELYKSKWGGE